MKRLILYLALVAVSAFLLIFAYIRISIPTILFLDDAQSTFYEGVQRYLRDTGFKCKIVSIRIDRELNEIENSLKNFRQSFALGPRTSSQAQKLLPLIEKYQIFTIAPLVTSPAVLGQSRHLLSLSSSDELQASHIASLVKDLSKVLVITDVDNPIYCDTFYNLLIQSIPGKEISRIVVDKVDDFPIPTDLKSYSVVVFVTEARKAGMIAQMLRLKGFEGIFIGTDYTYSDMLPQVGSSAVEGMFVYNLFDEGRMRERNFDDMYDAGAYDAMHIIRLLITEKVRTESAPEWLRGKSFSGASGDFMINQYLWAMRRPSFVVVKNGTFVPW